MTEPSAAYAVTVEAVALPGHHAKHQPPPIVAVTTLPSVSVKVVFATSGCTWPTSRTMRSTPSFPDVGNDAPVPGPKSVSS